MRRVVVIDRLPVEAELISRNGEQWPYVNGGTVFYADAVRALMQYGTYDHYYFLKGGMPPSVTLPPNATVLSPHSIGSLCESDRVVFFTPTEQPAPLMGLRDALGLTASPVIGFLHAAEPGWFLQHYVQMLFRNPKQQDALVCSSAAGRDVFQRMQAMLQAPAIVGPQLPLIRVGANTRRYHGSKRAEARIRVGCTDSSLCLLYFGRLEIFVKADLLPLLIMLAGEPDFKCVRMIVAGADTHANAQATLMSLATNLGIQDRLVVMANPNLQDKTDVFSAADVFISPADGIHETFGLSLVEAASAGLPIIASDWSGYRDIVQHGYTGFLARTRWLDLGGMGELLAPFDYYTPRTLALALSIDLGDVKEYLGTFIANPELRREMSERTRRSAFETYDWSVVVPQYERLFDELIRPTVQSASPSSPIFTQEVFRHYATHMVHRGNHLKAGPYISLWHKGTLTGALKAEEPGSPTWFDEDITEQIVQAVQAHCSIALDALIRRSNLRDTVPAWALIRHITKMVKFGLLQYV
jgi:glycosyltransferase involved in cell wall biosynthesis